MLRMTICAFTLFSGVALGGDQKAQAPATPAKSQAASFPSKIVTQTVITREYVPVEKRRKLFFKQFGSSKVETCTNCVNCPNCQK